MEVNGSVNLNATLESPSASGRRVSPVDVDYLILPNPPGPGRPHRNFQSLPMLPWPEPTPATANTKSQFQPPSATISLVPMPYLIIVGAVFFRYRCLQSPGGTVTVAGASAMCYHSNVRCHGESAETKHRSRKCCALFPHCTYLRNVPRRFIGLYSIIWLAFAALATARNNKCFSFYLNNSRLGTTLRTLKRESTYNKVPYGGKFTVQQPGGTFTITN